MKKNNWIKAFIIEGSYEYRGLLNIKQAVSITKAKDVPGDYIVTDVNGCKYRVAKYELSDSVYDTYWLNSD